MRACWAGTPACWPRRLQLPQLGLQLGHLGGAAHALLLLPLLLLLLLGCLRSRLFELPVLSHQLLQSGQ